MKPASDLVVIGLVCLLSIAAPQSRAMAALTEAVVLKNGTGVDVHVQILTENDLAAGRPAQEFPMRGDGELRLLFDPGLGKYALFVVPDDETNTAIPYRNVDLGRHAVAMKGRPLVLKGELGDVICPWTGHIANVRLRMWWEGKGPVGRRRVFLDGPVLELAIDQSGRQIAIDRSTFTRVRR